MKQSIKTNQLFDLTQTFAEPLLTQAEYPWEALAHIGTFINELGKTLPKEDYEQIGEYIWRRALPRYLTLPILPDLLLSGKEPKCVTVHLLEETH